MGGICRLLGWDTDFWGVRIGRVSVSNLTPRLVAEIDDWAAQEQIACIYFLCPAGAPTTITLAENAGFHLTDVRVTLAWRTVTRPAEHNAADLIRPARPADLATMEHIAGTVHLNTRFSTDPHFPESGCRELYRTWVRNSLAGWAEHTLVAEKSDQIIGYITCHLDRAGGQGSIGIIGVDASARQGGVGEALVRASQHWFAGADAGRVTVVTQGANYPALRLYGRCGFLIEDVSLWYHKWYGVEDSRAHSESGDEGAQ